MLGCAFGQRKGTWLCLWGARGVGALANFRFCCNGGRGNLFPSKGLLRHRVATHGCARCCNVAQPVPRVCIGHVRLVGPFLTPMSWPPEQCRTGTARAPAPRRTHSSPYLPHPKWWPPYPAWAPRRMDTSRYLRMLGSMAALAGGMAAAMAAARAAVVFPVAALANAAAQVGCPRSSGTE